MKQIKPGNRNSAGAGLRIGQEIALEFARIAKLSENGKVEEAWRAANSLHAKHPNDGTSNFIIALMLANKEKKPEALVYAERAVKLAPDNAIFKVFQGKLYVDLGMIEFAPEILHRAFAMDRSQYQAPLALANYFDRAGQGSRALPYYDQALNAAPGAYRMAIRKKRANCLRTLGRIAEAEAEFKWLERQPEHRVEALCVAALLRKNDHTSDYAGQVRKELERPDLTDTERSSLLLCLGRLHENGRDYDKAFLSFDRSRKLKATEFDLKHFVVRVNEASKVLTAAVLENFRKFGHPSEKPIFVVGMPRSGTTMTEQIIGAHSQAEGVGELARIDRMATDLAIPGGLQQILDRMREAGPERWKDIPEQYLNLVNVLAPGAMRTVDKMPHNFLHLGFIHLCFPNAKIIHCKRNPLDTFISAFQNEMSISHGYSYDQAVYGEYYVNYLRMMEHWKVVLPGSIYESQYESLTADPEVEVRRMLDFLGLPWEEGCLKFHEREVTVKTFSTLQVRKPINTGSVARWRNYEKHLLPIIAVLERAGVEF